MVICLGYKDKVYFTFKIPLLIPFKIEKEYHILKLEPCAPCKLHKDLKLNRNALSITSEGHILFLFRVSSRWARPTSALSHVFSFAAAR